MPLCAFCQQTTCGVSSTAGAGLRPLRLAAKLEVVRDGLRHMDGDLIGR